MAFKEEQKKIAANTIFLYLRMFVVMFISLFTSRVVLDKLGVEDYGIYNIVGSIVVSCVFVKNSLQSATQRYLSYSKGLHNGDCSKVFSASFFIHGIIIFVIIVFLESVGIYFFNNVIQIPESRRAASALVYQFSILTFCITILQVPYTALVISNERMSVYAFLSIIDVILKLVIVYVLTVSETLDKLILYAFLMFAVSAITFMFIWGYCKISLASDCTIKFCKDKKLYKEIASFSGWNLVGGFSSIASTECPNYLLNVFWGVHLNAAMGIAKQVSNAVYSFSANFQSAFNPQIVKSCAAKQYNYLFSLIFRTSKLSFFLLFVIAAPLIVCCEDVLSIWLISVPTYTKSFCIWIMISQLVAATSSPFWMAAHAIGNIKKYQLILVLFNFSILPATWGLLVVGFEPYWIIVCQVAMNVGIFIYRINYLKTELSFPVNKYLEEVIIKCLVIIPLLTMPILYIVHSRFSGLISIVVTSAISILLSGALFAFLGLTYQERKSLISNVSKKIKR